MYEKDSQLFALILFLFLAFKFGSNDSYRTTFPLKYFSQTIFYVDSLFCFNLPVFLGNFY